MGHTSQGFCKANAKEWGLSNGELNVYSCVNAAGEARLIGHLICHRPSYGRPSGTLLYGNATFFFKA